MEHHPFHRGIVVGLVDELRAEMRDAYDAAHEANRNAVLVMRRLGLAEALLETFDEPERAIARNHDGISRLELVPTPERGTPGRKCPISDTAILAIADAAKAQGKNQVAELARLTASSYNTAATRLKRARARSPQAVIDAVDASCGLTPSTPPPPAAPPLDELVRALKDTAAGRSYEPPRRLGRAPKPVKATKPEPKLPENTTRLEWDLPKRRTAVPDEHNPETVHYCTCGEERATLEGIVDHCMAAHGRTATSVERIAQARRTTERRRATPRGLQGVTL